MKGVTAFLAALLVSCGGGGSTCPVGSRGCECTSGGSCDPPLTCVGGVCVDGSPDTGVDVAEDTTTEDPGGDTLDEVECSADEDCDDGDPCTFDVCDLDVHECTHSPTDADGDGYPAQAVGEDNCGGTDCLDDLASAYPGAPSVACSDLDNDCNGRADSDNDGDGHVDYRCVGGDDCDDSSMAVLLGDCTGVNDCCDGCWELGCWYDPSTGYLWEDPPLGGMPDWDLSVSYCEVLSLAGHGPGQWHLPTIGQMRTFLRGCPDSEDGGACGVTDTCLDSSCLHDCTGCGGAGGPAADGCYWDPSIEGDCRWYWSSSSYVDDSTWAWGINFGGANVGVAAKGIELFNVVRCVHTGS